MGQTEDKWISAHDINWITSDIILSVISIYGDVSRW